MEASFVTVVLSAGVGGLAGSFFPSLRSAIAYIVFDSPALISKTRIEAQFQAEQAKSRTDLLHDVHKRTVSTRDAIFKAKELYDQLNVLEAESQDRDMFALKTASVLMELKNSIAYLEVFDDRSLHSIHAARLVECTVDFARFNAALIESFFEAKNTKLDQWIELEGAFAIQVRISTKWGSFLSGISGLLERLERSQKDQIRRNNFRLQEMDEIITNAKRKRLGYSVFLVASFVLLLAAVFLVARSFGKH